MAGYWGATADPNYGYSPYSGQLHYGQHELSSDPFTSKPGDGNDTSIETIKSQIHNMHPEMISALADQWQNAWTVLERVRSYVLTESNLLHDKHWDSPKARDAFLQKGPGDALAYLDVWMDAVQNNVTALRHLVTITQEARAEIDALVKEYEQKLREAQNVDFGGQLGEWVNWDDRKWTTTWGDAEKYQVQEQVREVERTYRQKAQALAYKVGNQHYEYTAKISAGVGPPYRPMNAVLNRPGNPPMPTPPALPGLSKLGAPPPLAPVAPPPPSRSLPANPTAPHLSPKGDGHVIGPGAAPAAPTAPAHPALPPDPALSAGPAPSAHAAPPPNPTLVAPLPVPPPGLGGARAPGVLPVNPTANLGANPTANLPAKPAANLPTNPSANLPNGLNRAAPTLPPGAQRPANPGELTRNGFGRGAGAGQPPGVGQPPGRTLRRPTAPGGEGEHGGRGTQRGGDPLRSSPQAPGRPGERRRGERADGVERVPGTPLDAEDAFGRPSGSPAPPVLKNPAGDRGRRRPGSETQLPPGARRGGDAGEVLRPEGTAPPVLNRPTGAGTALPPAARGRGDRRSATAPERRTPQGAEWIGVDDARADANSSVLDAPSVPPVGARGSGLDQVPRDLRGRAAARSTGPVRPVRPGTVAPELSKRRTTDERREKQQVDDEARGVVTDEQAFEVQTPGGGVVSAKRDEPVYQPELPRALGR